MSFEKPEETKEKISENFKSAINFVKKTYPRLFNLAQIMSHQVDSRLEPGETYGAMTDFKRGLIHIVDGPDSTVEMYVGTIVHELTHFLQKKRIKPEKYEELEKSYERLGSPHNYFEHPFEIQARKAEETAKKKYLDRS